MTFSDESWKIVLKQNYYVASPHVMNYQYGRFKFLCYLYITFCNSVSIVVLAFAHRLNLLR